MFIVSCTLRDGHEVHDYWSVLKIYLPLNDIYYNKVIRKESIIVFLREMKDVPYVTIEFDYETFEVLQARGKYNRALEPSLYQYVVGLGRRLCRERLAF